MTLLISLCVTSNWTRFFINITRLFPLYTLKVFHPYIFQFPWGNLNKMKRLIVPVHRSNHWIVAIADFAERFMAIYDSKPPVDLHQLESLTWQETPYSDVFKVCLNYLSIALTLTSFQVSSKIHWIWFLLVARTCSQESWLFSCIRCLQWFLNWLESLGFWVCSRGRSQYCSRTLSHAQIWHRVLEDKTTI